MRSMLAVAVWMLAACGGAPPPEPEPLGPDPDEIRCEATVGELRDWIDAVIEHGTDVSVVWNMVELARIDAPVPVPPRLPVIAVSPGAISFNGEAMADVAELAERMRAERRAQCATAPDSHGAANLLIDRATPWRAVRAATDAMYESGYDRAVLVFDGPASVDAPAGDAALDAAIATWEAEVYGGDGGRVRAPHPVEVAWGACDELVEATGMLQPDDRAPMFRALPGALADCDCEVDSERVKAIVWWWTGRHGERRPAGVEVALAATGASRRIVEADDAVLWADAHALIGGGDGAPIVFTAAGGSPEPASRPVDACAP